MNNIITKGKKTVYLLVLVSMLIVMAVFLNSCYWPYEEISKRKMVVGIIISFCIFILPILMVKINILYELAWKVLHLICDMGKTVRKNKKRILFFVCVTMIVFGASCVATHILSKFVFRTSYNIYLFYTLCALGGIGVSVRVLWRNAGQNVHVIFATIALVMGIFCIGVTPNRVGVSWDDEVHYANTLEIANVFSGIMYVADEKNIVDYGNNIYGRVGYDRKSNVEYAEQLEGSYESKEWSSHEFSNYGVWSVAYIPSAIGIILGRGLGLSYAGVFNLGRLCNLIMYIILISLAIKRMKYAKVLIAVIGLIPTMIFMASSYSYDPWVVGFTILGFSYFFAELQEDEPLKTKDIVIMLGSLAMGCLPKAIYFPILFPLLFMPKKKFKSTTQRRIYYLAIIGIGLFLVCTFLLPILINGAGSGDARGGEGVNSTEQIKFILTNPLAYAKILLEFELGYVALANSATMLQKFAYVGDGYFYSVISLMLAVLTFLDRDNNEKNYNSIRIAGVSGCAIAIILSTTALYVSFTAVGLDTILGMQARYMIPTIFPALYLLGGGGVTHKINKNAFVCVPMLVVAFTFICNMIKLCVLCY